LEFLRGKLIKEGIKALPWLIIKKLIFKILPWGNPKGISINKYRLATIDFIFMVKKALYEKYRRTFTTFYINSDVDTSNIVSSREHPFISYLRMSSNYNGREF